MTPLLDEAFVHKYKSGDDLLKTLRDNDLELPDNDWLCALQIDPYVVELEDGDNVLHYLPTREVRLYYVEDGRTGYFQKAGGDRFVVINERDMIDYTTVSQLHGLEDAYVYLATCGSYAEDEEFEVLAEWYRSDTFLDTYEGDGV